MDDVGAARRELDRLPDLVHDRLTGLRAAVLAVVPDVHGPVIEHCEIGDPHGADVGVAADVWCDRADGRTVCWTVEAWWFGADDSWLVNVKAEIDLDDRDGEDHCVLNEQEIVRDAAVVPEAITRAVALLVEHPLAELLFPG